MSGSDKVYIPEWMPDSHMVVCDEVSVPHSSAICSCTPRHRNPRPIQSWHSNDPLIRLADSIVYSFAISRYGDLGKDENFARAVADIKSRIELPRQTRELRIVRLFVCRCGAKAEIDTQGWGPVEHSEPWMCPTCRKQYAELCERQIDET